MKKDINFFIATRYDAKGGTKNGKNFYERCD